MDKVLRINMTNKTVTWEDLKEDYKLFGNRGLVAKVLNDEVDPACEPLGEGNKLVFALGMLAGTGFPTANRLSVGTKSPLTKGIKEANSGGNIGSVLARQGVQLMIVEGKPADGSLSILNIKADGGAELVDAGEYAGMGTYDLVGKLKAVHGDKIAVACIGGAGERGYANSTIQVTDFATGHPCRALARGGVGSVMGSKGLKAIVIEPAKSKAEVAFADKEKFNKAMRAFLEVLDRNASMKAMNKFGTMIGMAVTGKTGALPVKNFSGRRCEILEDIGVTKFFQIINRRGAKSEIPCQPGCPIKCHNTWVDENGEYVTSGFEYETVALLGSNCDIRDLDLIARIERLCDNFGIDTIELGATIGVCMEGGKIPWGDGEKALGLVNEIIEGTEFGAVLAQGTKVTGEHLGVKRIPCVKGQAMPGYDPRNSKGTGVGYATSPQGADHTVGTTSGSAGDFRNTGRIQMSQKVQVLYALADNFFCHFAALPLASTHKFGIIHIAEAFAGKFGGEWTPDRLFGIGLQTLIQEKKFNRGAGFTAKDDRLPQFFYDEPSPMTGAVFDFTDEDLAQVLPF
jgi:aldehyde:ferredoxin oxidoreductase